VELEVHVLWRTSLSPVLSHPGQTEEVYAAEKAGDERLMPHAIGSGLLEFLGSPRGAYWEGWHKKETYPWA